MYDSSTIKTDQVAVQLRHWYGSHTLCRGCTTLGCALLRSLALKHDERTFADARRRFDTITHPHWWKPDISWRSHKIKWKGVVLSRHDYIILLKVCPKKETYCVCINILLMNLQFFKTFWLLSFLNCQIFKYIRTYKILLFPTIFGLYLSNLTTLKGVTKLLRTGHELLWISGFKPGFKQLNMRYISAMYMPVSRIDFQCSGAETFGRQ